MPFCVLLTVVRLQMCAVSFAAVIFETPLPMQSTIAHHGGFGSAPQSTKAARRLFKLAIPRTAAGWAANALVKIEAPLREYGAGGGLG